MNFEDQSPFFSVVICTYNRAGIIKRALDSLIAQEDKDWESIIVDDGSDDDTQDVIQSYLDKYPVRYLRKVHNGCALSKNAGMEAVVGRYITFLDTDDEYEPKHLRLRHEILKRQPDIDLLHSNVKIIGNPYLPDKNHPDQKIHINDCVVGGTFFIKKSSLSPEKLFRDRYSDDSYFLEEMTAKGKNILKIDAPTYLYYRDMEDSLCRLADQ